MTDMAKFGVSGLSTRNNIRTANYTTLGSIGVAGLDRIGHAELAAGSLTRHTTLPDALRLRDAQLASISEGSNRLGDTAARTAWRRGVWFADYSYIVTPFSETEAGGYTRSERMNWRNGRDLTFSQERRALPLYIDSCGYRREITGTAPKWAHDFNLYTKAIDFIQPEGYAAWDYPQDRQKSLTALDQLNHTYPNDSRLWPVFSIRWTWDNDAHLSFARLPGWASKSLASLIPLNRTQRQFKEETRERMVRQAIANALVMADDKDFRMMVNKYGKVMLGGMVGCECNRMARHIFAAVLAHLFPDVQFWLLGQACATVINGLGSLGLLEKVWTDGTWWIKDATADRFAFVEDGLITMHSFETKKKKGEKRQRRHTFFTLAEMMAANLRSLLAAYEGLVEWPPPAPLPLDLVDVAQAMELKRRFQAAQLELGL